MVRIVMRFSRILVCLLAFMQTGCGCMYKSDPIFVFRGRISPSMDSVSVYVSSFVLTASGKIDPEVKRKAVVTNDSGFFFGKPVGELDCGESVQNAGDVLHSGASLQIYIDHPDFKIYHDSLGRDALDTLPRIPFEEAGVVRGEKEHGVWVLPDIVLQPR